MRPGTIEPPDSGQKCYRLPGEPRDGRPELRIAEFWRSPEEASAYLTAVRDNPRWVEPEKDQIENVMWWLMRVAETAAKRPLGPPVKRMPSRWHQPARPPEQTPEPPYEERLAGIFAPSREPGEDG